jgi:hypothetical protein
VLHLLLACTSASLDTGPSADTPDTGSATATLPDTEGCTDLNCDGWPDLVFARDGEYLWPKVYWGSPDGFVEEEGNLFDSVDSTKCVALEDLDNDGWLDVVFTRTTEESEDIVDSVVFFTTSLSPWQGRRVDLPTVHGHGVAVGDLDKDGWKDIVIANHGSETLDRARDSTIFWGSPDGFDPENMTGLPTIGGFGVSVADADGDGWLDILFSNYYDSTTRTLDSWLYLGGPEGFSTDRRLSFPTVGARGNLLQDVDGDGFVDAVFSSFFDGEVFDLDSLVYRGGPDGFDLDDPVRLPTTGAHAVSAGDLDGDGWTDLVFSAQRADLEWDAVPYSPIYWGSADGWSADDRTVLQTDAAAGQVVRDLDLDGTLDLVISNFGRQESGAQAMSDVYWGRDGRLRDDDRTDLPTSGSDGVASGPGEQGW